MSYFEHSKFEHFSDSEKAEFLIFEAATLKVLTLPILSLKKFGLQNVVFKEDVLKYGC